MRRTWPDHAGSKQLNAAVIKFTLVYILYSRAFGLTPSYMQRIPSASTALPHLPTSCVSISHEQCLLPRTRFFFFISSIDL